MYHALVRHRVRTIFERFNEGEWREALSTATADVHHSFPGNHPLGGERHSREALVRWFERLMRLTPPRVDVLRVVSRGWPWSTWVAVEWKANIAAEGVEPYVNHGAHWMHVRWGRLAAMHEYLDTQRVAETFERLAAQGIEEAAAQPITS